MTIDTTFDATRHDRWTLVHRTASVAALAVGSMVWSPPIPALKVNESPRSATIP